jgi:hypothetical protein
MRRTRRSETTGAKRPSKSAAPARRRADLLLGGILLLGLALRIWGVADRLPSPDVADIPMDDTAVDEGDRRASEYAWKMWQGGSHHLDLNPGTGDWPGLPFYLALGSQMAYRGYDLVRNPGSDATSFYTRAVARPAGIFLAGRLPSVLWGVLSVFLIYFLGLSLAGRGVGLFAAAFLAVLPFHVFSSQRISDPNLLSLVFMTAATIAMVRLMRTRSVRDSALAGAFVGLAVASKYLPVVLLAPLALAHVEGWTGKGAARTPLTIRWKALAVGLGSSLLAFALVSPFTFLDARAKFADMKTQQYRHVAEWAGISTQSRALPTYLTHTLPDLMTWPGYLLALLGLALLWRLGRPGRVVLVGTILFVAGVGTLGLAQPRFIFPAIGGFVVAAALGAWQLGAWFAARSGRPSESASSGGWSADRVVPAALAAGLVLWGLVAAAATRADFARPDARYVAHAWVVRTIPPGELLALDAYGPVLRRGADGRRATLWPFFPSRTELVAAAFHPEWLDGLHDYVVSSEVTRRFEGPDPRYAAERGFYAWLRANGRRVWGSDPASTSGPRIDAYELPAGISTTAVRDSIWNEERRIGGQGPRVVSWLADLSQDFLLAGDAPRAEEWARRGLDFKGHPSHQTLSETYALALIQEGRTAEAEAAARAGVAAHPRSPMLHLFHGMALEGLGRSAEAIEAYRAAIPLSASEGARNYLEQAIGKLEAKTRASRGPAGR